MSLGIAGFNFKKLIKQVDWRLLLFLVLFLNIKMPAKLIAIVFIYLCQFNFKFGFKLKNSRLPLFYPLVIIIAVIGLIINLGFSNYNYLLLFFTGIGFWLLSILAIHQMRLITDTVEPEKIHRTIIAFFIINAIVSFANLALIILKTGSINPYTFRGMNQTYFIMTGDFIKGVAFDISSTNAVLCALGVFYFLEKKNAAMLMVCMVTLLLTYSNLITLILLFILLLLFIFKSTRDQKSLIVTCLMLYFVFMLKVSPQNEKYALEAFQSTFHPLPKYQYKPPVSTLPLRLRPDSTLSYEEKRQKIATLYLDSIWTIFYKASHKPRVHLDKSIPVNDKGRIFIAAADTNSEDNYISKRMEPDRKLMLDFISNHDPESLPLSTRNNYAPNFPGKVIGFIQTATFLRNHPAKILTGVGIGNFSSKIAFRATGLGIRGNYPANHTYISSAFLTNHLDLYMSFFSREVGFRSIKNNPSSVYDQLLGEYGLLGLLALIIFYFGFFAKHYKTLTYGLPVLLFVAAIFFVDYWFEQLSVLVLFELMLFLNIREGNKQTPEFNYGS